MTEAHEQEIFETEDNVHLQNIGDTKTPDTSPRSWSGHLSDTNFTATFDNETWVLGVKVEAECPVLVQNAYADLKSLESHAAMFDFSLSFARGDACDEAYVKDNAMGLVYAKSFFGQTGINLKNNVADRRKKSEVDKETRQALQGSNNSADVLIRIASRIESRLEEMVSKEILNLVRQSPATRRSS